MLNPDRFEKMLADGLVARRVWEDTAPDGRVMLCALAALSDPVAEAKSTSACPASDLIPWLAELIPWLDDAPSEAAWPELMRRLGRIARALPGVAVETLRRADFACRAVAVRRARRHAPEGGDAQRAIDAVLSLLDRAAVGEMIDDQAWVAARAAALAAAAAAWAAARAAAWARAAARAAEAAAAAAAEAGVAAWVAAWAAWAAAAAEAEADEIAAGMLDVIERAVGLATAIQ
jgi:hypothetical protein